MTRTKIDTTVETKAALHSENVLPISYSVNIDFQLLGEMMPDAALLISEAGEIVAVNTYAEALFGFSAEGLVGRHIETVVPKRVRDQRKSHGSQFLTNPAIHPMAVGLSASAIRKDGSEIPVDVMLGPLPTAGSGCIIVVVRDLSGRLGDFRLTEATMNEMQHRLLDSEENERQRLAQALHDGPLQELHSLDFKLVALARQLIDKSSQAQLMEMRSTLHEVSRHLRALCQDLRPPALTPFGVSAVIRSFADGFQREHPALVVTLDLDEDGQRLSERVRLSLYRICQHALRNVAEHASAEQVAISLHISDDRIELCIADDGVGFEVPQDWSDLVHQGRFGLLGCLERAEAIGGHLLLKSQPDQGTILCITAPLTQTDSPGLD